MEQNDWHAIVAKPCRKEPMAAAVAELLQRDPSLDAVMDMALGQGAEAFRASRCVAIVYELDRRLFLDYLRRFVSDFGRVTQQGVRRIYGSGADVLYSAVRCMTRTISASSTPLAR